MSFLLYRYKNFVVLFISIVIYIYITTDTTTKSIHTTLAILPLLHGFIQLIASKQWNIVEEMVRVLYFMRNVLSPYLIAKANYDISIFPIPNESDIIRTISLFTLETLCVFIYMRRAKLNTLSKVELKLHHRWLYNFIFWFLFILLCSLYFVVPSAKDSFGAIWDEESLLRMSLAEEDKASGFLRILETGYSILFGLYRVLLPAYLLVIIKKWIKIPPIALPISFFVLLMQLLVVTPQSMSTLTNLAILTMLLINLYPKKRKVLVVLMGGGFVVILSFVIILKFSQILGGTQTDYTFIATIVQAYIPGVFNMQGVYKMPDYGVSVLFSDLYSIIPFRNSILNWKVADTTVEIYREINDAGGQIIPLIGQGYYHFGVLAPIISVAMIHISFYGYRKAYENQNINYLRYLFFIYLSYFAAMTPCLYFFSIFGQTFMTGMLVIYIMSILNEKMYKIHKIN